MALTKEQREEFDRVHRGMVEKNTISPNQEQKNLTFAEQQQFKRTIQEQQKKPEGFFKKFGKKLIQSELGFGQTLGDAIAIVTGTAKEERENLLRESDALFSLAQLLRDVPKDSQQAQNIRAQLLEGTRAPQKEPSIPSLEKTGLQIGGEAAGVAFDIASAGTIGPGTKAVKPIVGFLPGLKAGAKTGAAAGAIFGGGKAASIAAQEGDKPKQIAVEGAIGGITGGVAGAVLGGVTGGISGKINRTREIKSLLKESPGTRDVAKFKLKGGKVAVDKLAKEAIDQGIDETDVAFIKSVSDEDRGVFQKMFKVGEKASKDKTFDKRPVEEAGRSLIDRFKTLLEAKSTIGKELSEEVTKMPQKPIDITDIYEGFVDDLSNAGVTVKADGLDFRNSRYANSLSTQRQLEKVFQSVRPNKVGQVLRTPQRINRIRQTIFEDLNLATKGDEIADTAGFIIRRLRSNIDEPLVGLSSNYKDLTTNFAKISDVTEDFSKLLGRGVSVSDDIANLRAGEVGNRILGNAAAKPLGLIKETDDLLISLGKAPTNNVRNQFLFADFLEDLFGTTQTRGLRGQVGRGVGDAVSKSVDVGKAVLRKDPIALARIASGLKKGVGVKQIEAIRKLIGL